MVVDGLDQGRSFTVAGTVGALSLRTWPVRPFRPLARCEYRQRPLFVRRILPLFVCERCGDCITVILHDKNGGQLISAGKVHCFIEIPLGTSSVTGEGDGNAFFPAAFKRHGHTGCLHILRPDNDLGYQDVHIFRNFPAVLMAAGPPGTLGTSDSHASKFAGYPGNPAK